MNGPGTLGCTLIRLPVVLALLLAAAVAPAQAQVARSLADFAGTWQGGSLTDGADAQQLGLTVGDFDATITPQGDGFTIAWPRLRRGSEAANAGIERQAATLTFRGAGRPNVFAARESGNPMEGRTLSWARLHGATLSLYQLTLGEHGGFELTGTDRTLDADGLAVEFRLIRDAEPVRVVAGRASRSGG